MAKKNEINPVEPLPQVLKDGNTSIDFSKQEPAAPKEKLLSFIAESHFVDGNLGGFFAQYGYGVEWPRNEVRNIPAWLAKRCIQSGAEIDRADG